MRIILNIDYTETSELKDLLNKGFTICHLGNGEKIEDLTKEQVLEYIELVES